MGAARVQRRFSTPAGPGTGPGPSASLPPTQAPAETSPWARALASRWGILIVFPGLVLALGLFLTFSGQNALRESNLELAATRMKDEALLVSEHLSAAFEGADTVLDDLKDFSANLESETPLEDVALPLRRLIRGRNGVSYCSISFPDGTFEGAFVDEDGAFRFQVSRVLEGHTEELVYDYGPRGTLVLREKRSSQYDPRERPFYHQARSSRLPVWTDPYPFARTGDTGITRTVAVRKGPLLHAVLTIDFDVRRLSPLLVRREAHEERPILFDEAGVILADPQVSLDQRPPEAGAAAKQFALTSYLSRNDPVLNGFFQQKTREPDATFLGYRTEEGAYLAATAPLIGERSPAWRVAFLAPERTFLASLETHRKRSFLLAGLALLVATLLSTAFARLITQVRKEAADARAAARKARKEAKELGSYRLIKKLGEGGMGEVWRAEHRLLARQAAIKLIKSDDRLAASATARERFRREAQSLAALRSRNTIELFDYGVADDGTFFYVMELLDGLDLETLVLREGPQPVDRSLELLIQVCRSLGEAHEAGLVHRDIKPANIFVCRVADELDVVKVLDFGLVRTVDTDAEEADAGAGATSGVSAVAGPDPRELGVDGRLGRGETRARPAGPASAKESGTDAPGGSADASGDQPSNPRLTRADHVMGTPSFIAPEQALGGEVDGRADLYAAGCVAFWLLAGRTVFSGSTVMAELTAHLVEPPPKLEDCVDAPLPPGLSELVDRCLAKSPDKRPQTARELRDALTEILQRTEGDWPTRMSGWWEQQSSGEPQVSLSATVAQDASSARTLVAEALSLAPTQAD